MAGSVSMWGPNAQGVRSRPDRSVSLGDVRERPVQAMGLSGRAAEPVDLPGEGETWKQRFKVEADLAEEDNPFNSPLTNWSGLTRGEQERAIQSLRRQQDTTSVIRAGIFRVTVTELNKVPSYARGAEIEEGFLSDYGNVSVDFSTDYDAVELVRDSPAHTLHVPLGEARASLQKVGEIADSLAAEGYNVWGSPTTPSRGSLYASHGMIRVGDLPRYDGNASNTSGAFNFGGEDTLVLPGRGGSGFGGESPSQRLSDDEVRQLTRPEGFAPSPPMSGSLPGAPLQPPRLPDVGGFDVAPPMSGSLPGAPLRPPRLPDLEGFGSGDARREMQAAMQASSQRVNPQQEVFDGMGGWREQLAEARQKLKEAKQREAERAESRRRGRPIPEGPPIPGNQNPESGAASQFAPSGQLPVDPTAFRAPQGQTVDWFNNLSTEQKVGMALMLMSGGMAAGGGAAAAGGGAALRYGAGTLLPLALNQ